MNPYECIAKLRECYSSVVDNVETGDIKRAANCWAEGLTSSQFHLLEGRIRTEIHMGDTFVEAVEELNEALSTDGNPVLAPRMRNMKVLIAQTRLPDGNS